MLAWDFRSFDDDNMRDSSSGGKRAEWKDAIDEAEDRRDHDGGLGVASVGDGCAGGFRRSGRVLGPLALKDMVRG